MGSLFLNGLSSDQRTALVERLHAVQKGACFICSDPIDLKVHAESIDVDHVEPLKLGGKDEQTNLALTHASCNRSKQASDLRVARVLARFEKVRLACEKDNRGPNLSDVLLEYGGAKHTLGLSVTDQVATYSFAELGDNTLRTAPVYQDDLSKIRYFFAKLPIAYLHHDDRINPRAIGGSLPKLVEEFHRGFPQLHVSLAFVETKNGPSAIRVFDGQHKATAQVLLGTRELPIRVFVDPNPDILLTANTHAGTTLRQVAFDKSVQRHLGSALYHDRLDRYRNDRGLLADSNDFSEKDLVKHFKGESREMKRYILDAVRDGVTHNPENHLKEYMDFGGRGKEKPLSYSTIEKTFYSFFIYGEALDTPIDYRLEEGMNSRDLEVRQILRLMNLIAEEVFVGEFDPDLGTNRIENRLQKGEQIPEGHLRAFRLSKEEILYVWLGYVSQIVRTFFNMLGQPIDEERLFQYSFPTPLWDRLRAYVSNLKKLPVWVNHDLSLSVFGGKQNYEYWQRVFETGKSPQGQQVLAAPINLMQMINN
jgi:hypothetical protein